MVAMNDVAGAQAIVLKELNKEFGGSAEAAGKAGAGPFIQLKNQIGDLSEEFGKIIMDALKPFVDGVKSAVSYLQQLSPEAKKTIAVIAGIAAVIGPLVVGIGTLITILPTLAAGFSVLMGPVGLIIAGVALLAVVVIKNFDTIKQKLVDVGNYFVDLYNRSLIVRTGVNAIILSFQNMWLAVKTVFKLIWDYVKFTVDNIFNLFKTLVAIIKEVLTFDLGAIKAAIANGFGQGVKDADKFFKAVKTDAKSAAAELGKNIKGALDESLNGKAQKIVIKKKMSMLPGLKMR